MHVRTFAAEREIAIRHQFSLRVSSLKPAPPPQRVRLGGRLDSVCQSDRTFTLVLATGETLPGIAVSVEPRDLAPYLGDAVIITGTAVFRPSGAVHKIEADGVEAAAGSSTLWSRMPEPVFGELDRRILRRPQGSRSGLNAIIGRWPGDESEEEIAGVLQEIS
jgi:hypothetical protein